MKITEEEKEINSKLIAELDTGKKEITQNGTKYSFNILHFDDQEIISITSDDGYLLTTSFSEYLEIAKSEDIRDTIIDLTVRGETELNTVGTNVRISVEDREIRITQDDSLMGERCSRIPISENKLKEAVNEALSSALIAEAAEEDAHKAATDTANRLIEKDLDIEID